MKKYIWSLLLLAVCVLSGCKNIVSETVPELLEPVDVQMDTAVAEKGDMFRASTYHGEVVPYVEEICFETDGVLDTICVTVGEEVKKGQVLAVLDTEQMQEQIDALEETIADMTVQGEFEDRLALLDIEIAKEELAVMEVGSATEEACHAKEISIQRQQLELEHSQELRTLELEKQNVLLAQKKQELAGTEVTAPFDGTVVFVSQTKSGDQINSYSPVLCIADESRLYLQTDYISKTNISGAEKIYAKINGVDYPVTYMPEDEGKYISMMLSGADMKSAFSFAQESDSLCSGQYAALVFLFSCKEDVLTVPINALYRDGSGEYVYKIVEEQRVRCKVEVGMTNDVEAQILKGLVEGDVVYVKE